MAKKQTVDKDIKEIKDALKDDKVIIGTEQVLKSLKLNNIEKVYLTSNCPEEVKEKINGYCNLNNVKTIGLRYPNDETGVLCKKPFSISVLGLAKGAK